MMHVLALSRRVGCALALVLLTGTLAPLAVGATSPSVAFSVLSFSPNPVIIPDGQNAGDVTIHWDSGNAGIVPLYCYVDNGAPEQCAPQGFLPTASGSLLVHKAIAYGHTIVGRLYMPGHGKLLNSVTLSTVRFDFNCGASCLQLPGNGNGQSPQPLILNARAAKSHYWNHYMRSGTGCLAHAPAAGGGYDYDGLAAATEIVEGYSHFYDPGTDPFPCPELSDDYYRGAVNFDLGAIRQYVKANAFTHATLSFTVDYTDASYDVTYCLAHLQGNTLDWSTLDLGKDSPLESGFALNGKHIEADVLTTVSFAVLSDSTDLNFLFIGSQEGFPQDNDRCATVYRSFALTLTP